MAYSEEEVATIVKNVADGMSMDTAARVYNIPRSTIRHWVRTSKGLTSVYRHHFSEEEKLEIIKKASDGESISGLSREYNLCEQTIRNWIKEKNKHLALYSVQRDMNFHTEAQVVEMPKSTDSRDLKIQNHNLKEENEYLKAKIAYMEELMKLSNIPVESFKKKLVMKQSTEFLKEGKGQ